MILGTVGCITPMQDVQVRSVVCSLAGVHASCGKITDSRGWKGFFQPPSHTGMFMYISSVSGIYRLSILETMQDKYAWVHARQLIVNMRFSGLLTPTHNGPGSSGACPGNVPKHDINEGIMTLAIA